MLEFHSEQSEAFVGENAPVNDLGCDDRSLFSEQPDVFFEGIAFFQVIYDGEESLNKFLSLSLQEKVMSCSTGGKTPLSNFEAGQNYKDRLINDEYHIMDSGITQSSNLPLQGNVGYFQNIKWTKCSKGGRVENIRPGRISRLRKRRDKKDDDDDGEDNRQPSDPHALYIIFLIAIMLMLFLIILSLIIWLMR
ncbi:uncharacterized protein LOC123214189 [Mangifera indica]|uniref:uncharacterized protein LOC123214189 n=1 Tax=Mangifera indica TaxID=29780 RepID=UPI001CF95B4B|nr:uncharacterized protein LOC123214189 [Mangifera indica]